MTLNIKTIAIDADKARLMTIGNNSFSQSVPNLTMYQGTEYVLQANVYSSFQDTGNVVSFANTSGWECYIGNLYGTNANPIISVTDPQYFNNLSDWSMVDESMGAISIRINTTSETLTTDLANASSDSFQMQVWTNNNSSSIILVLDTPLIIHNSTLI